MAEYDFKDMINIYRVYLLLGLGSGYPESDPEKPEPYLL